MCWYLLYPLSYRNLEEMMALRGLAADHSTIARSVLKYAAILNDEGSNPSPVNQ
jgi:transposase-like protein